MSYYSGTAGSLAALETALKTHAQADGWVLTGNVLSKAGVFFQITSDAANVLCLGCESNAAASPAPNAVMMGRFWESSVTSEIKTISFPCNYEVFGFADEIYMVVNYSSDLYQYMAFGKSHVPGLPGQGGWCSATCGSPVNVTGSILGFITISSSSGGYGQIGFKETSAAPFWTIDSSTSASRNSFVNHNLDGHGWTWNGAVTDSPIGIPRTMTKLLDLQPSVWNSEAVLLPIRAYKQRASFKVSLVVDLENARTLRIDNLAPGDIITLGPDKWKIFPFHRKDITDPDGGTHMQGTGTFGWAIKYEGP